MTTTHHHQFRNVAGSALAGAQNSNITAASNTLHSSVRTAVGAGKSNATLKASTVAAGKATLKSMQKATDKKAGPLYHNKVVSEFIAS